MRILYIVHKYPPHSLGGTELHTWSLARAMARLGHEVTVFYPLQSHSGFVPHKEQGVREWRSPLPASRGQEHPVAQFWHTVRNRGIESDFLRCLHMLKPEVVHFQHVQGVSARLIVLAAGRPRIATLHDYWYFCANSQLVRPDRFVCADPRLGYDCVDCATVRADLAPLRRLRPLMAQPFLWRNRYLHRLLAQMDLLITPSRFLRDQYRRFLGPKLPPILVSENGLDLDRLALREVALPSPPARPHFGFLGSIAWQKGVHVLIEAFNRVRGGSLTIYGDESIFPAYAAEVRSLARHAHIRFAGRLDPALVGTALRQIDCLVVPSLWYENSPLVIQEAFALGVPVVASRLGALPEKVRDGIDGRLFRAGDVEDLACILQEFCDTPEALARLAARTRPGPSIDEQAKELLARYQYLLGRSSANPQSPSPSPD